MPLPDENDPPALTAAPSSPPPAREPATVAASFLQIPVTLQVVIGTAHMPLSRMAELEPGAIVNLDERLGSLATILINGREVARGTLFVMDGDGALGITVTDMVGAGLASG